MNPRLVIQQQICYPDDWGLYIHKNGRLQFICQISKGWMTEYSYTTLDSQNLPSDPKWGWRTVLLRLMARGVFTFKQLQAEFGDPQNANTSRWRQQTLVYRSQN